MGAINGLAFAIAYPERLSALVMIDAGPEVRRPGSSRIREFVNGGAKPETLGGDHRAGARLQSAARSADPAPQPDAQSTPADRTAAGVWKYDRQRFQRIDHDTHLAERRRLADGLANVTCPALVVRGAESDVFHQDDAERLAQNFPDGRLITIAQAGHTVQGDNPKDLVAALREFLG